MLGGKGQHVTTHEPVIVDNVVFLIERDLGMPGEVAVRVNDLVEPDTIIATAKPSSSRALTLHLARELNVSPNTIARYLTKPIGERFEAGEAVARARRGLRVSVADAPEAGTLTAIDETAGTATLVPETASVELRSFVYGQVETVRDGFGALIRSSGARLRGALGLGNETAGPLKVAIDRPDRELTPDGVSDDLRDAVVLGGMTVGAAAIRRLAEVGARAVVVGSISEAEVRRAFHPVSEVPASSFWWRVHAGAGLAADVEKAPLTIFVTEGFGRRPMAGPIFEFLSGRDGQVASILLPRAGQSVERPPELAFTMATLGDESEVERIAPADGLLARLVDPANLGTVVTCRSEPFLQRGGAAPRLVVEVEAANGERMRVPVANVEILTAG